MSLLADVFMALTDFPLFRRLVWKPLYEVLARRIQTADWHFMNYGYVPADSESPLTLPGEDPEHYATQLYHYLVSKVDLLGCVVLEVGSGRGGGAYYISKHFPVNKITALDISESAVRLANQKFASERLCFVQGDAERLAFEEGCFDVVVNVESSHAYASVPTFLNEVRRVLKPGGYFLCADLRSPTRMTAFRAELAQSGLMVVLEEEITKNIINALEAGDSAKKERIQKNIPAWLQEPFGEFAGVAGSKIHEDLKSGKLVYYRFVTQKDALSC